MAIKDLESLTDRELEVIRLITEGLSDREISQKLYLSINTVKWHNRQIYQKLGVSRRGQAAALASELGLLEEKTLSAKLSFTIKKHNLPAQISSFIGREEEIQKIKTLLGENRLITLTGPGGVGKTRLALQVADQLVGAEVYENGVFFVELAAVSTPEQIVNVILDDMGIPASPGVPLIEGLKSFLETKTILLVLDNFEHLLQGAIIVKELLEVSPDLSILCTSREALKLTGEQLFPLQPLAVNLSQELFIQRAREVQLEINFSEKDLPVIDQICSRLDCLPLAIELAAARMNLFSLKTLQDKLEDRFGILTDARRDAPARHQNLQKTIDWSFRLLDEEEQILFRRLGVFQGTRSIDAVEEVCCFDLKLDVLDGLASLLAKNLIRQEQGLDGESRFYMLETVHEYTRQKINLSGEEDLIRRKHAEFFVALAGQAKYPSRGGPDQIRWLKRLEADHDNLRAMYDWAMTSGEFNLALRLVGCLDYFWMRMGSFDEAEQWTTASLVVIDEVKALLRADVYSVAGSIAYLVKADREKSKDLYRESLELQQLFGEKRDIGWIHIHLAGPSEMVPNEREFFMEHYKKGCVLLNEVGDKVGLAQALTNLGVHERLSGNGAAARDAFREGLEMAHENGDKIRESVCRNNLGCVEFGLGNFERAEDMFKESLLLNISIGHSIYLSADRLSYLAGTAANLEKPERAIKLLGASDMLYKAGGHKPQPTQIPLFQEYHNQVRELLDESSYQAAWAEGQSMTPEEAIAYALEEDDPA